MGYVLVDNEWYKKDCREKFELPKVSKSISNPMITVLKKLEELKDHFKAIAKGVILLQESISKLLDIGKSTSPDIRSMQQAFDGIKQEVIKLFTRVFTHMDSLKSQGDSSNDDFAIFAQNSYSFFFKNVEKSYEKFFHNFHNTLTYFLAKR
ncbi:hypothetical protein FXO37_18694 [Capsicum annuum]|nr:hypothetical protein FXO37_18694 [Capsicum annuum]